jgi:hypothetical protein
LSDLLAPRESAREAVLLYNISIITGLSDQSANKERKSGSLAPPLPTRVAATLKLSGGHS